jgi:hypothetical protein
MTQPDSTRARLFYLGAVLALGLAFGLGALTDRSTTPARLAALATDRPCPAWITTKSYAGPGPVWHETSCSYHAVGDADNDGTTNIYVVMYAADGSPAFSAIATEYDGGVIPLRTDHNGAGQANAVIPMTANSNFNPATGVGPYSVDVAGLGSVGSDRIGGFGLIASRHEQYWVTLQLVTQEQLTPTPVPQPTSSPYPGPTSVPNQCLTRQDVIDLLRAALGSVQP